MHPIVWLGAVVAGVLFLGGRAVEDAGEGVDSAGSGALKLAAASAIGVGAWIAIKRLR